MYDIPVLILAFNRPQTTAAVLQSLESIKPTKLYVCVDGARADRPKEASKVQAVKDLFKNLSWKCEVHTLFREHNLGCRDSVSGGITWFFEQESFGIILEDDCVAHPSFFQYCRELLLKYENEEDIFQIAGFNPINNATEDSYFFSNFSLIWGWATWRRAWEYFHQDFKDLDQLEDSTYFKKLLPNAAARSYMMDKFEKVKSGELNSWAYAWFYSILSEKGLCIMPTVNLIQNVGFGEHATLTVNNDLGTENLKAQAISFPLQHPDKITKPDPKQNEALFFTTQKKKWLLMVNQVLPKSVVRMVGNWVGR